MEGQEEDSLMMEVIKHQDKTLAMIVRADYQAEGISFFTPAEYSQQLAYMHHPKDHEIIPHVHNRVKREVYYTNEVLVIKKGTLECDFYTEEKEYIQSCILQDGDILLLVAGGHGFRCLSEVEFIEIKQGPYAGENDKVRFESTK